MNWSGETHCFIHDEIVTALSKEPTGLSSAFPNFAASVQTGSLVGFSAFPSSNLKSKPAPYGGSALRTPPAPPG